MKKHRSHLRKALAGTLSAAMLLGCVGMTAMAAEAETFTLGIYSTTDMHGKCYDLPPLTARK